MLISDFQCLIFYYLVQVGGGCSHAGLCDLFKPRTQNPGLPRPARYLHGDNRGLTWSFRACCKVEEYEGGVNWSLSCNHLKLELTPGDAQHYFASRWKWTKEEVAEVAARNPGDLWACRWCKVEYRLARFPELNWGNAADGDQEAPEDGDLATEVGAVQTSTGTTWQSITGINMYWYGAGVFPKGPYKEAVGINECQGDRCLYTADEISGRMHGQQRIDKIRYLRDNNNSLAGYRKRFVFAYTLEKVLQEEEAEELREPTRPPIGLNPERFAIQCIQCEAYVYRAEYSDAGNIICATCRL